MKNINKFALTCTLGVLLSLLIIGCNDDTWDNHYKSNDARLESSLMDVLSEDTDLTGFVSLLKQTGNDTVLAYSQAHTVWAPTNEALESLPDEILNDEFALQKFVDNHIGRFSYNTSSVYEPVFVKMLNNKYIEFKTEGGEFLFGDVSVIEKDMLANNGIVHKINDILAVNANIWGELNVRESEFPVMMDYLKQFNKIVFDEANSVVIGRNSLGQNVYDSIFVESNSYFDIIGELDSEERRYTTVGLTDEAYTAIYDDFKGYFFHPVADSVVYSTNKLIFDNINFPPFEIEDMGDFLTTTTGNNVKIDPSNILEDTPLSNGNLLVVSELGYDPRDLVYKSSRYEIENDANRTIGSIDDLVITKRYDESASNNFYNVVSLVNAPNSSASNNYFEVSFSDVAVGEYEIKVKFRPVGASQQTKLNFEFYAPFSSGFVFAKKIGPLVISNTQEEVMTIGEPYITRVYVGDASHTNHAVRLRIKVDVTDPELVLYDRTFGIDYVELVPVEPISEE